MRKQGCGCLRGKILAMCNCTVTDAQHSPKKTPTKGGTNKSEWCKRSWRVSNWAIWKHPIMLLLKSQKSLLKGEKEVLGVKLWSAFVNKSSKCCFMQKTQELQGRSNMLTNELCLLAELRWVVCFALSCVHWVTCVVLSRFQLYWYYCPAPGLVFWLS